MSCATDTVALITAKNECPRPPLSLTRLGPLGLWFPMFDEVDPPFMR